MASSRVPVEGASRATRATSADLPTPAAELTTGSSPRLSPSIAPPHPGWGAVTPCHARSSGCASLETTAGPHGFVMGCGMNGVTQQRRAARRSAGGVPAGPWLVGRRGVGCSWTPRATTCRSPGGRSPSSSTCSRPSWFPSGMGGAGRVDGRASLPVQEGLVPRCDHVLAQGELPTEEPLFLAGLQTRRQA